MPAISETTPLNDLPKAPPYFLVRGFRRWLQVVMKVVAGFIAFVGLRYFLGQHFHSDSVQAEAAPFDDDWMPNVLENVNYSIPITFQGPPVIQQLFDTGLMECYGFAFGEAEKTALLALHQEDENGNENESTVCPMCYWLLAMSHSPYINNPSPSLPNYLKATQAADKAASQLQNGFQVTIKEQGLIAATKLRFSTEKNQTVGYEAYRNELEDLHSKIPDDLDTMAFLADAIMILHYDGSGYHFYEDDNVTPRQGILRALELLDRCLDNVAEHPLCLHLYIHITEPSRTPDRGETTADHLFTLVASTQAQHLQHMPSHTYLRIGRYHDAISANIKAHISDEVYLEHGHLPYGPAHDTAFLVHAAQLSGEKSVAYQYADQLREHYTKYPDHPDYPGPSMGWHLWRTVRLRCGDFDAVLQDTDETPSDWPYATVLGHYSKGIATLVASSSSSEPTHKRLEKATKHLKDLQATLPRVEESLTEAAIVGNLTLTAAIEYWNRGDGGMEKALNLIQEARKRQESWAYTEPPGWYMSVSQCEATLLRLMEKAEDAISLFQNDLQNIRENRFGLHGLMQAMIAAGGNTSSISIVQKRLAKASKWADEPEQLPLVCPLFGE